MGIILFNEEHGTQYRRMVKVWFPSPNGDYFI